MEDRTAYRTINISPWNVRKGDEIMLFDRTVYPNRQTRVIVTEVKRGILGPLSGKRRYQIFYEMPDKSDIPWWVGSNWGMWYSYDKVEVDRKKVKRVRNGH